MSRKTLGAIPASALILSLAAISNNAAGQQPCNASDGQLYIDQGRYTQAIREFTCIINAQPTAAEGYRGRAEAELLLGEFSNAARDYARIIAFVMPVHPDAQTAILASYSARLSVAPNNIPALTGASFARWWFFDYPQALHLLGRLLAVVPNDVYGNLFQGSTRLLSGNNHSQGAADLERALALAPSSPDVRFIVADAYTYGQPNPTRALAEASLALNWGLDTPRIHAILAVSYMKLGNPQAAAAQLQIHISQVTTQLLQTSPLGANSSMSLGLVAGRTYEIPVAVTAGQTLSIATSSRDFYDTVLVLLAPDGTPVVGSDDYVKYFAGLDWVASTTGTYRMRVTSFEGVNTGELVVTRK